MAEIMLDRRFKSDEVFCGVSRHFITLKDEEMQEYNVHFRRVLDAFIEEMKKEDPIFRACFRRIAYVGSYYEGLKVGKPEEFDLNIIINLPIDYSTLEVIIAPEKPGYIKLKGVPDMLEKLQKHVRWAEYNGCITWDLGDEIARANSYCPQENHCVIKLSEFFTKKKPKKYCWHYRNNKNPRNNPEVRSDLAGIPNNNSTPNSRSRRKRRRNQGMEKWIDQKMYLDQNKFRQWFESVGTRAFSAYPFDGEKYLLKMNGKEYLLKHQKNGPAWTLKIDVPGGHTVDVDLVPALEFANPPPEPFINRNTRKQNWFAISKPLDGPSNSILWRPSFYEREQDFIKGPMKPIIRQMKKLRDTQNAKSIASYYIKTLFLRELEKLTPEFQKFPMTFKFYYMLQRLQEACAKHEIIDYWNPKNNLLGGIKPEIMSNISFRLSRIIKEIDNRIANDPYVIAEYIHIVLDYDEMRENLEEKYYNIVIHTIKSCMISVTKDELVQLKELMQPSRLADELASLSLVANRPATPEPLQNEQPLSGMWNSFWATGRVPASL